MKKNTYESGDSGRKFEGGWDSSLLSEYVDMALLKTDFTDSRQKSGFKDFLGKAIGYFNGKINEFKDKYNASDLMGKIASVAKKAGASTVYYALLIYYALMSDSVPTSKKVIAIAALGYFIAPVDFIPDFVLMGLLDDGSVLLFALNQILPYITEEDKAKALAKLHDWFGDADIISLKSGFLPGTVNEESNEHVEKIKVPHEEIKVPQNMEMTIPYKELNDYLAQRLHQPISVAYEGDRELRATYTKRVLINMSVNVRIGIEEVRGDSVTLSYDVAFGLHSIANKALSYFKDHYPELSAGIHPEEGRRVRVNLSEIEKTRHLAENIELKAIIPTNEAIRIEFGLKTPKI